MKRHYHDVPAESSLDELFGEVEAVHIRKQDLQHDHVRRSFFDFGECVGSGVSFSDADYVVRRFDHRARAGDDHRMVIDEKSADWILFQTVLSPGRASSP